MKQYTIFAGVNGAGKTSLYSVAFENNKLFGERVNSDELVREIGDWSNKGVQFIAGKRTIELIETYIKEGVSFIQETTLAGTSIPRFVQSAKDVGFKIVMYYVGVNSPEIAKERVRERVLKGGHGIDEGIIERRYYVSQKKFISLIPQCDEVFVFDNSGKDFLYILSIKDGKTIIWENNIPEWINNLIPFLPSRSFELS